MFPRIYFAASLALAASLGCNAVAPDEQSAPSPPAARPEQQLVDPSATGLRCLFPSLAWVGWTPCASLGANDPSRIVRFQAGAPPLVAPEVRFWAVRGQARQGSLRFQTAPGAGPHEYVKLTIPAGALRNRPNGQPIAPGDSVLITIRALSTRQMIWQLLPEGLTFNPWAPAQLVAHYDEADHDFDGDGDIDLVDRLIEAQLAIWRQPLNQLFAKLLSVVDQNLDQISADVPGFSRFGIAY